MNLKRFKFWPSTLAVQLIAVTAAGVLVTYGLYTVNDETLAVHRTRDLIWTLPFVAFGLFRFLHRVHFGNGGRDPAQDLMRDPWLAVAVVAGSSSPWRSSHSRHRRFRSGFPERKLAKIRWRSYSFLRLR